MTVAIVNSTKIRLALGRILFHAAWGIALLFLPSEAAPPSFDPLQPSVVEKMALSKLQRDDPEKAHIYQHSMQQLRQEVQAQKYRRYLLYFTSASIPATDFINTMLSHVEEDNLTIQPIMRGIASHDYLQSIYAATRRYTPMRQKELRKHANPIRIAPKLFDDLNVSSVPAFALARCPKARMSACEIYAIGRGSISYQGFKQRLSHPVESYFSDEIGGKE